MLQSAADGAKFANLAPFIVSRMAVIISTRGFHVVARTLAADPRKSHIVHS